MRRETTDNTFDRLFRQHYANLVTYASLMVDEDDAKDIVQDVFSWLLKHSEKIRSMQGEAGAKYLMRSVYNGCMNRIRDKKYEHAYRCWLHSGMERDLSAFDPDRDTVIFKLFTEDIRRDVFRVVEKLPAGRREVFVLAYQEGLPHKRIAEITGTSVSTVENQLYAALKTLRGELLGEESRKLFKTG